MIIINTRSYEEIAIINHYKWADGFNKKRMNKMQLILGDGSAWGFGYIILGYGLMLHMIIGGIISVLSKNSIWMEIIIFLAFPIGLGLEVYCQIQRDKVTYNSMINREKQMNLFRDFYL